MRNTPKVGDPAPGFELPDSSGERRTLEALLNNGNVVLIFFRGVW